MLTTVPRRRRVCLSFPVGATACDLGELRRFKVSSVAAVHGQSCQSLLFEVLSGISKVSRSIRLRFVWCEKQKDKEMSKEMYDEEIMLLRSKLGWLRWTLTILFGNVTVRTGYALTRRALFRIFWCAFSENKQNHSLILVPAPLRGDWTQEIHPSLICCMSLTPVAALPFSCKLFCLSKGN